MRRSHVEMRSYNYSHNAPRQFVAELDERKPEARPVRETNKMTQALMQKFGPKEVRYGTAK